VTSTLRDVARLAGVSISTASRALNDDRTHVVAPETRERIWQAVQQLNYEPNDAAQRLVRRVDSRVRRTYNIGLILGQVSYKFSDPFWSPVLDGVDEELIRQEYHLRFAYSIDDLKNDGKRALLGRAYVDGVIVMGGIRLFESMLDFKRTVMVEGFDAQGRWKDELPTDIVAIEKRRSMYRLVDHLVGLGHRRLGFLGPSPADDERAEAFIHALLRHRLPYDPALCLESPWRAEGAYEVAKTLLDTGTIPDALVCGCDTIAIGVMRAAKECGLRLPDDLAVTGFDDISFARDLDPPLTTIHVPKERLGELAVRKLIERINHPERPPDVQMVPTKLVVRRSCGAPASDVVDTGD
jgi:DNA-binding LacI/PurR family transcriptional regulator